MFWHEASIKSEYSSRKHVQGCAEISVWFVYVTDCYCSGEINLNKFFLAIKSLFVQNLFLNNFGCINSTEIYVEWISCFHIRKREASGVFLILEPCDQGSWFYLEKNIDITWYNFTKSWVL